jgi:hypothetical protein
LEIGGKAKANSNGPNKQKNIRKNKGPKEETNKYTKNQKAKFIVIWIYNFLSK